jgi:hypothetical protein
MWFNGRTPASQAGGGGSIPLIRSIAIKSPPEREDFLLQQNLTMRGIEPERALA